MHAWPTIGSAIYQGTGSACMHTCMHMCTSKLHVPTGQFLYSAACGGLSKASFYQFPHQEWPVTECYSCAYHSVNFGNLQLSSMQLYRHIWTLALYIRIQHSLKVTSLQAHTCRALTVQLLLHSTKLAFMQLGENYHAGIYTHICIAVRQVASCKTSWPWPYGGPIALQWYHRWHTGHHGHHGHLVSSRSWVALLINRANIVQLHHCTIAF